MGLVLFSLTAQPTIKDQRAVNQVCTLLLLLLVVVCVCVCIVMGLLSVMGARAAIVGFAVASGQCGNRLLFILPLVRLRTMAVR